MIPYSRQRITDDDIAAVTAVLNSDFLTQGPIGPLFEEAFAARHEVAHAVAVANATAGLHIACLALDVGPGSRVWTTPNSFLASANCALYCGATIDFVDMDPATRNISVPALSDKLAVACAHGELPDVLIPVDFSGMPCDLREIRALADRYGFRILQDASHATGASYLGAPVGSQYADATVFSLHAVKIITSAEGGVITTQDRQLARRLQLLRSHGMVREPDRLLTEPEGPWVYEQQLLGFNYRLTELQAALALSQLKRMDAMQVERSASAQAYDHLLGDLPVVRPIQPADRISSWHLYAVELPVGRHHTERAQVFEAMRAAGIGVNVHYIPIHLQPYYAQLGFRRGDFPAAEAYYARAITLPLYPGLTFEQQEFVVTTLARALKPPSP